MRKLRFENLAEREELREAMFHLKGIVESQEDILNYLREFDLNYGKDLDKAAKCLSMLEVEIFYHLSYHMKELRAPFKKIIDEAYAELGDLPED